MSEEAKIERLTCTKLVCVDNGRDAQGRKLAYHKKCGAPASEVEIGGTLAKAKAVLCVNHKLQADREYFTSVNGYPLGKIAKKEKANRYQQTRLPGTGVTGQSKF